MSVSEQAWRDTFCRCRIVLVFMIFGVSEIPILRRYHGWTKILCIKIGRRCKHITSSGVATETCSVEGDRAKRWSWTEHWPKRWCREEQLTQDRGTHSSVCLLHVSSQLNGFIASQLLPQLKSWLDAVPEGYCTVQGARVIIAPSNSREILNW